MSISSLGPSSTTIQKGIRLVFSEPREISKGRLRVSSGIAPLIDDRAAPEAVKPRSDWRELTDKEFDLLTSPPDENHLDSEFVCTWRIPSKINERFEGIRRATLKHNKLSVITNLFSHSEFRRGRMELFNYLRDSGLSGDVTLLGNYCSPTGMEVTSIGSQDKSLVGLHIDSWKSESIGARGIGFPSRLAMNMGPETRYLLFINLSIRQIIERATWPIQDHPNRFTTDFFQNCPNYPVIRLSVEPGEGYSAPTEYMIHDSTTVGKDYCDALFTILGDCDRQMISRLHAT